MKDLQKEIEELVTSRNDDISKAVAEQSEEIDFLKAELTSAKVRLHDALSQSQAEKDALIRHADASRAELLQQMEELRREYGPVSETERQSSFVDSSESPHIKPSKCNGDEALGNEYLHETEAVSHNVDNSANLSKKLELLRELVKAEKEKWTLQQTDGSDSQQVETDTPDGSLNEAAPSHKIRSSWVVLEEQVLPLIEKFCTPNEQGNRSSNSETVLECQENETLPVDEDGKVRELEETMHSLRGQLEKEKQEVIRLEEVVNKLQDSVIVKDEAVREMETKCRELQVELDSVLERLQSQEALAEKLSANADCANEQLKNRTAELSDKDVDIQKLNAEIAELKERITEKSLALQADWDERLNSERRVWQTQIDARSDELSAKCAEMEQHELTLKALSDQCSMLTAERDAKTAELVNSSAQMDSLVVEINAVKKQLNDKTVELHEAQIRTEHERKLLKDETECETLMMKSQVTSLEDEIRALQQQLESKTIDMIDKDEALTLLDNRSAGERAEFQAKIADLEDQLSGDQRSSAEQLNALRTEVKTKEAEIRECQESHAAYCQLPDSKLAEFSDTLSAKEDEIKSLREQHKVELLEKCEISNKAEERLACINSQVCELTNEKHNLECEVTLLTDKLKSESENVAQLEKTITELSLAKEACERELEDLRSTATAEMEHTIILRDEQITALKSALLDKDHSLSLLNAALSQTSGEDVQLADSSSHTIVTGSSDSSKDAEGLDAESGDAGPAELCDQQSLSTWNYDVPMMIQQINSLGAANTLLLEKIGRLEADLLQIRQTTVDPVDKSSQCELASLSQPASCSSG